MALPNKFNTDQYLKGVKDIIFRYGGPHVELAKSLYERGFLSFEEKEHKGMKYIPFGLVIENAPEKKRRILRFFLTPQLISDVSDISCGFLKYKGIILQT